jgi:hypothetical protein
MKMAVFWVVAPYSLVEVYRRFRGACCLHHQDNDLGSKQPRNAGRLHQTSRPNIPEDGHLDNLAVAQQVKYSDAFNET